MVTVMRIPRCGGYPLPSPTPRELSPTRPMILPAGSRNNSSGRVTQTGIANTANLMYTYSSGNLSSIQRTNGSGASQTYGFTYDSFAYCLNNPMNMTDTEGNLPFLAVTAIIGAVVGAVAGDVVAAKSGGNVWAGIGIGAVAGALVGTGVGMAAGAALAGSITATTGAVMTGGSALLNTVATGGFGAGVSYISNNLSRSVNNATPAVQTAAEKMRAVAAKGKAGEMASGLVKNTQRIYITATKYRIPDGLDAANKILSEVKNYFGTLSYTAQLRDFVSWSQANGYQMHLYTNAHLTGPLQQAVDSGLIQIFPLK